MAIIRMVDGQVHGHRRIGESAARLGWQREAHVLDRAQLVFPAAAGFELRLDGSDRRDAQKYGLIDAGEAQQPLGDLYFLSNLDQHSCAQLTRLQKQGIVYVQLVANSVQISYALGA